MTKNSRPSQCDLILKHLQEGRSITPLGALSMFGCNRLAARIYELRKRGYKIEACDVKTYGDAVVAMYYMPTEAPAALAAEKQRQGDT